MCRSAKFLFSKLRSQEIMPEIGRKILPHFIVLFIEINIKQTNNNWKCWFSVIRKEMLENTDAHNIICGKIELYSTVCTGDFYLKAK